MKTIYLIPILLLALICSSCEYDNYDAPSYQFEGQLKSDGQDYTFDGNAGRGLFVFLQEGYGKVDNGIGMRIDEKGTYKQLLFKDKYALTLVNRTLPFELEDFPKNKTKPGYDTIFYDIKSNVVQDFNIKPYYVVGDVKGALSADKGTIEVQLNIDKMAGMSSSTPKVSKVWLYVSTSTIVNSSTKCVASKTIEPDANSATISIPVSTYRTTYLNNFRDYAFYRVAIELEGISDYYLFSETYKIEGLPTTKKIKS